MDVVEASNLQRQTLFGYDSIDRPKTEAAVDRLKDLNPHVELVSHLERFAVDNALDLLSNYDLVVDGSDNFPTRYLVNDACVMAGKPLVFGSIFKFEGQVSVFNFENGPTYRCLFPECPNPKDVPNCAEIGVFGALPGIIGAMQAVEVIKILTGVGTPLSGKLLIFDALSMRTQQITFTANPDNRTIDELKEMQFECDLSNEDDDEEDAKPEDLVSDVASNDSIDEDIDPVTLPAALRDLQSSETKLQLVDVREEWESEICSIEGATLIPLGELRRGYAIPPGVEPTIRTVVYCKAGVRGEEALHLLREKFGFSQVSNLEGGILAWIATIDPSLRSY
ncbi:MAG: ThiF family adenylyltransferase [Opitutales bacterium]